ncbi:hypothetical protein [Candidatus Lokiarchaeum ossiferum]|uniref:hypothetical protein n=1 Tax=Candidatus Lokiarchaeum ossiferum TaxID=2951803 RepID=UPI00352E49B9
MTIEIDDSGTGDLIGSAFILFWRRETNELVKKEVPLELYQSSDFNTTTKNYIRQLFIDTFEEMKIPKTEDIYLCTGPCFDEARVFLKEEEYNYQDAKIEGYLQDMVEQTYLDHIIEEFGVPQHKVSVESGKKRFFAIFHWITKDFPRRKVYVKSGFEKWHTKWEQEAEQEWIGRMIKTEMEPLEQKRGRYSRRTPYQKRNPRKTSKGKPYKAKKSSKTKKPRLYFGKRKKKTSAPK